MILAQLQIILITALAVCFSRWRAGVRRRNAQSWNSIVGRLRLDCTTRSLGDQSIWNGNLHVTPQEKWQLISGARGLWTMYENASVMLEMADYAARNSDTVDLELLAGLRSDAMQIRVCVLTALAKYAFSHVNESICVNVSRAASMYTEMSARTAELLQTSGREMIPDFVPAMCPSGKRVQASWV
jgi:hypothetical protein